MSSIDNRIVQMQFENSQFEKGIKESLKTLDDLEKKLEFKDAERGLAALQKAGDSFSLATMADGIDKIGEKFSVIGIIGKRVLENLTDSAVRMGEQFIKSVSIDQISSGWNKYADKTSAVQTIIAATGKDIGYVDEQLSKLAWFTDETSYNFVDMTSNIGKFTSMGIDLDTSVTAMEGIATWAAVSGQNAQAASRAMYNMSQAIGVGSVKLMDWKSIENANMATKEFKETAISTAKALGKLNAQGKTAKGTAVTFENFSQTLSEGWFSKDVLLKTLEKYGEYANAVYEVASEKGIPAAEAMKLVSGETMKLGEKAFKAAQEAKTFTEAIDSVKDAVSTGWMNIFEQLFGNYEEAKVLWTDLANYLWDMFAAPLADTVDLLSEWKKLGGRTEALEGIYGIFEGIADIVATVKDAIASVFPETTAEDLLNLSERVKEFGKNFRETFTRTETEIETNIRKETQLDRIMNAINSDLGDRIGNIRLLQEELVKLGYLSEKDYVSGLLGPSTLKAFENYQNGVKTSAKVLETELNFGDKGKEVEEFQKKLFELGFDPGGIDGIWGKKTQKAYDNYIASLNGSGKAYKELKKGMRDDDVRELQEKLINAGLLDRADADGIFGPKTEAALKKYQKAQGLKETGIFDKKTYDAMYPEKAEEAGNAIEYETETVIDYSDKLQNLYYITQGLASGLHILTSFFGFLGKVIGHVGSLFSPLIDAFIAIAAALGNSITEFDNWLQEAGVFDKWFEDIKKFLEPFGKWVQKAADGLLAFFGITKNVEGSNGEMMTFVKLWKNITDAVKKTGIIDKITKAWRNFVSTVSKVKESLKGTGKAFKDNLGNRFTSFLESIPGAIASVVDWLGKLVSNGLNLITPWIDKIPEGIQKIKNFWAALTQEGNPAKNQAPGFLVKVRDAFRSVIDFLFGEGDVASGKSPGVFRRLGRLIMGDLEGFTEGMDENTKNKVLNIIQGAKDFIQKVREAIFYLFGGKLSDDKKISDDTLAKIDKFKEAFAKVIEIIGVLFTGEAKENSKLSKETIDRVKKIRNTIIGVFDVVKDALLNVWNTIVGVFTGEIKFESIGEFFTSFWESIKQFFSDITGVAAQNLGNTWKDIETFFSGLWNGIKNLGKWLVIGFAIYKVIKFFSNFSNVLGTLKSTIKSYRKDTQPLSKSMLQFAIAIGIIAGSIWLIGQLDGDQFARGVAAVGGIITILLILLGLFAFSKKFRKASESMKKFGNTLRDLAIGIGIIAVTIVALGALVPWETLGLGLVKLAAIMAVLVGFIWVVNKIGGAKANLKGFWQIALVIGVMSFIAVKLGKVPISEMTDGIIALGAIMAVLAGFVWVLGKVGANKIKMKGFIGLSIAIGILAIIAAALGKIKDQGKLWRGIGAVVALMAMVAGMAFVMGKWGKDIKIGSMIVLFVGVIALLLVFKHVVQQIKDIDPSVMYAFSLSLAIALAAFLGACLLVGKLEGGFKAMTTGAAAIALAFDILVALVGGLVLGLGAWNEATGGSIESDIESGGRTLKAIGEALSGFIGALNMSSWQFGLLLGACLLVGKLDDGSKAMVTGSAAISGAFDILVALVGALVLGLGAWNEATGGSIESDIESGGRSLKAIGAALSGFAGTLSISGWQFGLLLGACLLVGKLKGGSKAMVIGSAAISGAFDIFVIIVGALLAGIGALDEATNGGVIDAIERGGEVLRSIGHAIGSIKTGFQDAENEGLKGFAEAISSVNTATEGMSEDSNLDADIAKALEIAQKIHDFFENLTLYTINTEGIDGYVTAASELSSDMSAFGQAIEDFRVGVVGISDEKTIDNDTDTAIRIAKYIKENFFDVIADQMPNGQGLIDYNNAVSTVLSNVKTFAVAMGTYHTNISGFNSPGIEEDNKMAIAAAKAVAGFLVDLKEQSDKIELNKSAIDAFFTGDTVQGTVFDAIESLGLSVQSARQNIKGIGGGTFEKDLASAMTILTRIVGILAYLKQNEIVDSMYSTGDFDTVLSLYGDLADKVIEFNDKLIQNNVSENATSSIATIMGSLGNLVNVLSGDGENKLSTENFLSGLDLDSVTTKLNEFSGYLSLALDDAIVTISDHTASFNQAGIDLAQAISTGMGDAQIDGPDKVAKAAIGTLSEYKDDFDTIGRNFSIGLTNGVYFNAYLAINAARAVADAMAEAVRKAFNSHSPSRVAEKIGNYFTEGLAIGTENKMAQATNAASTVADSMLATASGTLASISELLADDIDATPVISPVVDLTNARASAQMIGGLFGNQTFGVNSQAMAMSAQASTFNGRPVTIQNGTINTSEAMSSVNEKLNALSSALTSSNNGPHVEPYEVLSEKFGDLADAVTHLKIVLDSGVLVGELSSGIDSEIGSIATLRDRGN